MLSRKQLGIRERGQGLPCFQMHAALLKRKSRAQEGLDEESSEGQSAQLRKGKSEPDQACGFTLPPPGPG